MPKSVLVALALCCAVFALVACPGRKPRAPSASARPTAPAPAFAAEDAAAGPAKHGDSSDASNAAPLAKGDFSGLGGPCVDAAEAQVFCAEGKVVGVWRPVDTVHGPVPPPGVDLIADVPAQGVAPRRSLALGVEGDRLWFRLVTCGACRRVMGWAFAGSLSGMNDEQLRMTQTRLGLPPTPLLRTKQAWQAAYAADAGRAAAADAGISNKKPQSAPPGVPGECINAPPHQPLPESCRNL